ncbi:MAG TPA: CDP-alcohol phosphatidyltransferase [Clostridium sp.]|nr:CDP-alcohol phosphatidyltransferase [Clostridium sp.]
MLEVIDIRILPNLITLSRIFLSILLFMPKHLSITFFVIYTLCGLTDVLDGYIARTLNCTSKTGALLDSIADVVFTFVVLAVIIPMISWSRWMVMWIVIIILIRIFSLIIGYIKYHALAFLHIYSNKAAGLLFFLFPFMMIKIDVNISVGLICSVAFLSAVEELIINMKSEKLERDITSIFQLKHN